MMTEAEKLIYKIAINDAREVILASAEDKLQKGYAKESIAMAGLSGAIAALIPVGE